MGGAAPATDLVTGAAYLARAHHLWVASSASAVLSRRPSRHHLSAPVAALYGQPESGKQEVRLHNGWNCRGHSLDREAVTHLKPYPHAA